MERIQYAFFRYKDVLTPNRVRTYLADGRVQPAVITSVGEFPGATFPYGSVNKWNSLMEQLSWAHTQLVAGLRNGVLTNLPERDFDALVLELMLQVAPALVSYQLINGTCNKNIIIAYEGSEVFRVLSTTW